MKPVALSRPQAERRPHPTWPLGQAKARFSHVVRLARSGQPQHVTVHGHDAVVIVATPEFERLTARGVPNTLHALLSQSPLNRVRGPASAPRPFLEVDQ